MTNEEALERIDYARRNCDNDMDCDGNCELCDEAMDMAIQALKKQIPKKPKLTHHCPNCGKGLPVYLMTREWCKECFSSRYCPECGQKLDWSDSND